MYIKHNLKRFFKTPLIIKFNIIQFQIQSTSQMTKDGATHFQKKIGSNYRIYLFSGKVKPFHKRENLSFTIVLL